MKMYKKDLKGFFQNHMILMKLYCLVLIIGFPITGTFDLWQENWHDAKDGFSELVNSFLGKWAEDEN